MSQKPEIDFERLAAAGLFATLVMGFFMAILPKLGLPQSDVELILASLFNVPELETGSGIWYMSMTAHFLAGGIVIPLLYSIFIYPNLDIQPWAKGLLLGFGIFLFNQSLMMPFSGLGFFSSAISQPGAMIFESLFISLVYGGLLGEIATPETALRPIAKDVSNLSHGSPIHRVR